MPCKVGCVSIGRQSLLFRRTHYTGTTHSLQPACKSLQLSAVPVQAAHTHYAANSSRLYQAHSRHQSSSGSIKALPRRQSSTCDAQSSAATEVAPRSGLGTVRQFLIDQFLPVGLLLAMLLGLVSPPTELSQLRISCLELNIDRGSALSPVDHCQLVAADISLGCMPVDFKFSCLAQVSLPQPGNQCSRCRPADPHNNRHLHHLRPEP